MCEWLGVCVCACVWVFMCMCVYICVCLCVFVCACVCLPTAVLLSLDPPPLPSPPLPSPTSVRVSRTCLSQPSHAHLPHPLLGRPHPLERWSSWALVDSPLAKRESLTTPDHRLDWCFSVHACVRTYMHVHMCVCMCADMWVDGWG